MKKLKPIVYIIALLTGLAACNTNEECRKNRLVSLEVGFYRVTYNDVTRLYTTSVYNADSLTVQGLRVDPDTGAETLADSVLYNNRKSINKIILPLNKFENLSAFILKFNQTTDTLRIYHTNSEQYLSLECGSIIVHRIDTVLTTRHFSDSVRIINHNVNNTSAEHLRLYN